MIKGLDIVRFRAMARPPISRPRCDAEEASVACVKSLSQTFGDSVHSRKAALCFLEFPRGPLGSSLDCPSKSFLSQVPFQQHHAGWCVHQLPPPE